MSIRRNYSYFDNTDGRIEYDTLPIKTTTYPFNWSSNANFWGKYAPKFQLHNTTVFYAIEVYGGNARIYEDLKFITIAEFIIFINNNIENDGSNFTESFALKVYDRIDSNIPIVSRMYGMNKLMSQLLGRHNYKRSHVCNEYCSATVRAIGRLIFVDQNPWASAADWNMSHCMEMIWTNRKFLRRYAIPPVGGGSPFAYTIYPQSGMRYFGCDNWEGPAPVIPTFTTQACELENPRMFYYGGNFMGGGPIPPGDFTVYDLATAQIRKQARRAILSGMGSAITSFRVKLPNTGDGNWAVFIKPVGIDTVYLNYFDTGKYALEIVYYNRFSQIATVRNISGLIVRQDIMSNSTQIDKSAWTLAPYNSTNIVQIHSAIDPYQVRFRLRDIHSGKVGPLSPYKICLYRENKWMPARFIVQPV